MSEFLGVAAIKQKQEEQTNLFEQWALKGNWGEFHANHYDWWAFPIDKPSSFGFKYTLDSEAIAELQKDQLFLASLAKAATLLLRSWGWDTATNSHVVDPGPEQGWANWPIRLSKCNRSLKLFGLSDLVASSQAYALWLKANGESFEYNGRDLYPEIQEDLD